MFRVEDLLNFDDEDDLEADTFGHLGLLEDDEINTNQLQLYKDFVEV